MLQNLGLMAWCIILLEYPTIVWVHEVHKGLQMVTKLDNTVSTVKFWADQLT